MIFQWLFIKRPHTYISKINGTITIGEKSGKKSLFSGGVTQSGGEIAPMWEKIIGDIYTQGIKPKNILILGVGGGSVIHAIRTYDKKASITGIEMDPFMKQVALEQFGIKENEKQKIVIANAIFWVQKQSRVRGLVYDTIIVDLYIGPLNPEKARTHAFLKQVKSLLKPKGIVLYNAHYQKKNIGEYEVFRRLTNKTFHKVEEVFSYPLNRVLCLNN